MRKQRRVPQRTCIGCRTVRPKRDLVPDRAYPQGVIQLDVTGKQSGRGAHMSIRACIEQAFKRKLLEKALETSIDTETIERLRGEVAKLQ